MSWNRLKTSFTAAILAATCAAPALADSMIVRASGPSAGSYPPGKRLSDAANVSLKANDQLVLLDARGTRTLRGPGTFSVKATATAAADGGTQLAALVTQRNDRRVRIGAVRSVAGTPTKSPNIWYVDTSRGGTVCLADPAQVTLWRVDSTVDAKGAVGKAGAAGQPVAWTKGQATQPWPAGVAVSDGGAYRITTGTKAVDVKVALTGPVQADLQAIAATLIARGCTAQLDLLVETSRAAERAGG